MMVVVVVMMMMMMMMMMMHCRLQQHHGQEGHHHHQGRRHLREPAHPGLTNRRYGDTERWLYCGIGGPSSAVITGSPSGTRCGDYAWGLSHTAADHGGRMQASGYPSDNPCDVVGR
jgi:hypothetical protein